MTTRRQILKGLIGCAAALALPPTLAENAEAARRFWALDQTMLRYQKWSLYHDGIAVLNSKVAAEHGFMSYPGDRIIIDFVGDRVEDSIGPGVLVPIYGGGFVRMIAE